MESFIDLQRLVGRVVDVMLEQKENMDDIRSMISAISPSQEIAKEDYDRAVASSLKAESVKMKEDSFSAPSPKRSQKGKEPQN